MVNIPATGGVSLTAVYKVEFTIPHATESPQRFLSIPDLDLAEADLSSYGFSAILGRDVLAHCVLIYDGPAGGFSLCH